MYYTVLLCNWIYIAIVHLDTKLYRESLFKKLTFSSFDVEYFFYFIVYIVIIMILCIVSAVFVARDERVSAVGPIIFHDFLVKFVAKQKRSNLYALNQQMHFTCILNRKRIFVTLNQTNNNCVVDVSAFFRCVL